VRPVNGNGRKREEQLEGQQAASEKVYEQFKSIGGGMSRSPQSSALRRMISLFALSFWSTISRPLIK
jgi:hypothetical protein